MDIRYSNEKCELGRNFANKLWNACRFRQLHGPVTEGFRNLDTVDHNRLTADEKWIIAWLDETIITINKALEEFKFHLAAHEIYEMVWSSFCDWFIEAAKVRLYQDDEAKQQTLVVLDFVLFKILRLLHPFMPFITEELAHQMGFLRDDQSIMDESYPTPLKNMQIPSIMDPDPDIIDLVEAKFQLIRAGRALRAQYDIPPGKKVDYYIKAVDETTADFLQGEERGLKLMLNAAKVTVSTADFNDNSGPAPSQLVNAGSIYLPLENLIDIDKELAKLQKQQQQLLGWIKGSNAKLENEKFLSKAPETVVKAAREHLAELQAKLKRVEDSIATLNGCK